MDLPMLWIGPLTLLRGSLLGKARTRTSTGKRSVQRAVIVSGRGPGKDHRLWGGTKVTIGPSTNTGVQIIVLGMMELICRL
jgi:hypothetical protein